MKTLVFYYFGHRIVVRDDGDNVLVDVMDNQGTLLAMLQDVSPVLQNEILYRMQEHVKVEHRTQRTLRFEIHTQTGKPIHVVVPMLVNMQKGGAADAMKQMGTDEGVFFDDVPY